MTVMIDQQRVREALVLQAYREELVERIGRAVNFDGSVQPLSGLHLYRHSVPLERVYSVVDPSVCVVAQGSKEFLLGESRYRYDPFHYLLVTVDLPSIGQILEASKERPFLSLRLSLDPGMVSSILLEAGYAPSSKPPGVRAIDVSSLDAKLLDLTLPRLRYGEFFFHSATLPVFRLRGELVEGGCPEALPSSADEAVPVCPTVRDALAKIFWAAL